MFLVIYAFVSRTVSFRDNLRAKLGDLQPEIQKKPDFVSDFRAGVPLKSQPGSCVQGGIPDSAGEIKWLSC